MRFNSSGASAFPASGKKKRFTMPSGEYDYEVVHATEGPSKSSGVPMITLTVKIDNGMSTAEIKDYLVSTVLWKIQQFAESAGLADEFEAGSLDYVQCTGAKGRCKVEIQTSEQYGDKNVIKAYLAKSGDKAAAKRLENDDIPW